MSADMERVHHRDKWLHEGMKRDWPDFDDWLARVKREAAQEATDREARRYKAAIDNWKAIAADAERKIADAWDAGARWAYEEITGEPENRFALAPGDNPHRKQVTE